MQQQARSIRVEATLGKLLLAGAVLVSHAKAEAVLCRGAFALSRLSRQSISYGLRHGKPAVAVDMSLDAYDEIEEGSGIFQARTPRGRVRVVWRRRWERLEKDEEGRPQPNEFSRHPIYILRLDSPRGVPVCLRTRQHEIAALWLDGQQLLPHQAQSRNTSHAPHIAGSVDSAAPTARQTMEIWMPGGHHELKLRMNIFWSE